MSSKPFREIQLVALSLGLSARAESQQLKAAVSGPYLSWLERTPDKGEVGSSNLPRPTTLTAAIR